MHHIIIFSHSNFYGLSIYGIFQSIFEILTSLVNIHQLRVTWDLIMEMLSDLLLFIQHFFQTMSWNSRIAQYEVFQLANFLWYHFHDQEHQITLLLSSCSLKGNLKPENVQNQKPRTNLYILYTSKTTLNIMQLIWNFKVHSDYSRLWDSKYLLTLPRTTLVDPL